MKRVQVHSKANAGEEIGSGREESQKPVNDNEREREVDVQGDRESRRTERG